jgi:uncharacterized membrane protein
MIPLLANGLGAGGDVICICSTNFGLLFTFLAGAVGLWKKSITAITFAFMFSVLVGIIAIMAVTNAEPPSASEQVYDSKEAWRLFGLWATSMILTVVAMVRVGLSMHELTFEPVNAHLPRPTSVEEVTRTEGETAAAVARFREAREGLKPLAAR